ncbi:zinc ribbon domain-containing protein [Leptospira idonii]|uniref:Zinc ribbon domain-containing protein n=1 Tax=Leptospira idonii TaxID=1193500 RepID=A0A4R9LXR4_9LEPT|nr:FmdB family zinc ribbon protein [Leptospira idonii]TGN18215.1 zinc ribbon domain-containing protein [Leptospira idonii]
MATYDYNCKSCGKQFEYVQSMKDDPITKCILCGTEGSAERMITGTAGIIFKGSGFYVTDYKKDSGKSNSSSPSVTSTSTSPNSESTAAPKTESSSDSKT